jgi:peroxiredoxin
MSIDAQSLVLALLALSVAFNLFLTLRLTRIVGNNEYLKLPMTLPTGQPLPMFEGRALSDGRRVRSADFEGHASVLLFFSPECKDCQARVAEISAMYAAMRRAGLGVWVLSTISKRRMREFLENSPLLDHVLIVSPSTQRTLNPRSAAPFYIFIDHERTVLASNFIGDEDWSSFCEQMRGEIPDESAAA